MTHFESSDLALTQLEPSGKPEISDIQPVDRGDHFDRPNGLGKIPNMNVVTDAQFEKVAAQFGIPVMVSWQMSQAGVSKEQIVESTLDTSPSIY